MNKKSRPWNVCDDSLEPLAKDLLVGVATFAPDHIDFPLLLRKHSFDKAIAHLQILVSVDFSKQLEDRVQTIEQRIRFLNAKAWEVLLEEWGPLEADAPEHEEYDRAAWIFSDRWTKWFYELGPDDYPRLPEATDILASAYRAWITQVRSLSSYLFQISEAIKNREQVSNMPPSAGEVLERKVHEPQTGNSKNSKARGGRPRVRNSREENQILKLWCEGKGRFVTHSQLDDFLRLESGTTRSVIDRVRKRDERRRMASDETDETDETNAESGEQRK